MRHFNKNAQVAKHSSESAQGRKTVADFTITKYKMSDTLTKEELHQLMCKDIAQQKAGVNYTYNVRYDAINDCRWLIFNLLPESKGDFRIQFGVVMKQLFEERDYFKTILANAKLPDRPIYLFVQADRKNLERFNRKLATDDLFRRTFFSASNLVDNMFNSVER